MKDHTVIVNKKTGTIEKTYCQGRPVAVRGDHYCGGSNWICTGCNSEIENAETKRLDIILKARRGPS